MSSLNPARKRRRKNDGTRRYVALYLGQLGHNGISPLGHNRNISSYNTVGFGNELGSRNLSSPSNKICLATDKSLLTDTDVDTTTVEKDTEDEKEICEECTQIIPDQCDKCNQYIREVNDEIEKCGSCEQELNRATDKKSFSGTILKDGSFRPNCQVCKRPCVTCPKCAEEFELDEGEEEDDDSKEKQSKQSGAGTNKKKGRFSHLKDNF